MRRGTVVVLALLCVGACAKKAGPRDAAAPEAAPAVGSDYGGDGFAAESEDRDRGYSDESATLDELQARFEELDADLSSQGITEEATSPVTAGVKRNPKANAKQDQNQEGRCERICSLKEAICDVSARICGLAENHEDDPKYVEACARSASRCEHATQACSACSD